MRGSLRAVATAILATAFAANLSACAPIARYPTPEPSCACASLADPNWTPPPVSPDDAARLAEQYTGVRPMGAGGPLQPSTDVSVYLATGDDAVALVDAMGGGVVAMVRPSRLPEDARLTMTETDAESEARAYMTGVGIDRSELIDSVEVVSVAGVSAYRVDFRTAGGGPSLRTLVNGSTGDVYAFFTLGSSPDLDTPLIGKHRAVALAIAALGVPGEVASSAELTTDGQHWTWDLGMGVPSAADPEVYEHGAYVTVDAASGRVTIVKDAR